MWRASPTSTAPTWLQLAEMCSTGRIRPRIDRVFPLEQTAAALGVLSRREAQGKVILVPGLARLSSPTRGGALS